MEHFYQGISGWFNFDDIYSWVAKNARDGAHFVEVGAWLGCSTAFMAVEIINSGKKIQFDVVDTWQGTPTEMQYYNSVISVSDPYEVFKENIKSVAEFVNPIRKPSVDAAQQYEDESLDFVFIDACHDYECVKEDIHAWLPKVKLGGIIAGHDYDRASVKNAVDEMLQNIGTTRTSWVYHKK